MPDINEYVARLKQLKASNPVLYNSTMDSYKASNPAFYQQLLVALGVEAKKTVVSVKNNSVNNLNEYVTKLKALKLQSLSAYNQSMENYKNNYPAFYNQLIVALQDSVKPAASSKFKEFFSEYKFYLIAICVGIVVIIYLLFLVMSR